MSDERPLRIHFLTSSVHEQGTYFRFHNLAIGLTQLGQKVTVFGCDHVTSAKSRIETRDGVEYRITRVAKGTTWLTGYCHPLTSIHRCFMQYPECDIAHLFQPFPNAALAWQWRQKAKVLAYDWDDLWYGGLINPPPKSFNALWLGTWTNHFEKRLPSRADVVTTCSRFLSEMACERRAKTTAIIHNGFWPFEKIDKKEARETLGLDRNALYVGFMGRTLREVSWCLEAVAENMGKHPNLRIALCGTTPDVLDGFSSDLLKRVDDLGQISPLKTRDFAAALDIGLLPLDDTPFNRSRFPIKFAEYMAAETPVLCSEVGECSALSQNLPWVVKAGTTKNQWMSAFAGALDSLQAESLPGVDSHAVETQFSWEGISQKLLCTYHAALGSKMS